jgi:hypothetical protein
VCVPRQALGDLIAEAPARTRELPFTLVLPGLVFDAAFNVHIDAFRRDGVTLRARS